MPPKQSIISKWKIICTFIPYIWGDNISVKLRILLGLLLIIITMALNLGIPLILKNTIEVLSELQSFSFTPNYHWAALLLLAYGGIYTLGQITLKSRQIIFYKIIERAMRRFSLKIFTHLHNLDLKFHLQRKLGAITNSVEKFQHTLPDLFWNLVLFLAPTVIEVFLAIIILLYMYHWSYAGIVSCIFVCFLIFSFIGTRWTTAAQTKYESHMLNVHAQMVDSFLNYETVRHFNNLEFETKSFDHTLKELEKVAVRFRVRSDIVQMLQGTIVGLGLCVLTWRTGHEVLNGTLQIADFIAINSYLLQFIAPMVTFGLSIVQMNQAFTKLRDILQLLEKKPDIVDSPHASPLNRNNPCITFANVSFQYQSGRTILDNISFQVPAGKTLAIVGTSGAGKSTIAKLLFRFYNAVNGSILISNQDINTVTQNSLHAAIGVVSQDTTLFNTTLYKNILYGNPDASEEEVREVVRLTHLDQFIEGLPEGFNTVVGERGLKLSGGEKQRVSIARALLKKPSIFLFDEATSSLDTATEHEIKNNIMEISQGVTTVIIAHRLSTITHANTIIVLDKGKIVESGKHDELLERKGTYCKLWDIQVRHNDNLNGWSEDTAKALV